MSTNNTRQAFWISVGNFFSALVAIVAPMILARYWTKYDYGTYKQVMYVYNILLMVFTIGLPKAYSYFIPRVSDEEKRSLINKITNILICLGSCFSMVLFWGADIIGSMLNNKDLSVAIRWFSLVPLCMLPTMGIDGIFAAYKKSMFLAIYTIITRSITVLCTIFPILYGGDYIDSIIGFDIASIITCVIAIYMRNIPIKHSSSNSTSVSYKEIFNFSIPLFTAAIWGFIISSSDQFFISRYYGNEVFAEFSNGFMELPFINMLLGAITTVLLPEFSRINKKREGVDNIITLWQSTLKKSIKIVYPMASFCIFFSTTCILVLYGSRYENSSIFFLLKNLLGLIIIIPFQPIILSIGKTREYSMVHMYCAICIIIVEILIVNTFNSPIAIALSSVLCQILKFFLQLNIITEFMHVKVKDLLPFKMMVAQFVLCAVSAMIVYLILFMINNCNIYIRFIVSLFLYLMVYYILCLLFKNSYKSIAISLIPNLKDKRFFKLIP